MDLIRNIILTIDNQNYNFLHSTNIEFKIVWLGVQQEMSYFNRKVMFMLLSTHHSQRLYPDMLPPLWKLWIIVQLNLNVNKET